MVPALGDEYSDIAKCASVKEALRRLDCYDAISEKAVSAGAGVSDAERAERIKKIDLTTRANVALSAVKRFQTKLQTGLSYRDYSSALADAKFEVRQFIDNKSSVDAPDFIHMLNVIVRHYDLANTVWSKRFIGASAAHEFLWDDPNLIDRLGREYPRMSVAKFDQGINVKVALQVIWNTASEDIGKLAALAPK